jgi:hypothetical protein
VRQGRPDYDAITPEGTPIASPLGLERVAPEGVEPGPSVRRAEAWGRRLLRRLGSRRLPSGAALARGARPPAGAGAERERGKPCTGCYRHGTVNGETLRRSVAGARFQRAEAQPRATFFCLSRGHCGAAGLRYVVNKECYAQLRAGKCARKPYEIRVFICTAWAIPRSFVGDTTN